MAGLLMPLQVASVEPHHFATLMSSLDFGLNMVSDNVVLQSALEGLAGGCLRCCWPQDSSHQPMH
jgi:hypothetical protein